MNISLLISGNLTGFGRFYTSPAAKELLGNERIDLDNHNHLTFLEKDEKAYSITFAKRYIAISQYTQILDSFRRPGKLVVSVLVPRSYMIVPNSGLPKGAVYSLLTKISDKFYEKNFQDGMINQNPAVLGQDYYSEILDGYSLAPSDNRRINEDPSPVKKIGYVRASELDMPSYLDTPYRKSYGEGGFNLVFFAPSAPVGTPNSIDEEPTEVVLYRVRILNTGAILPNPVKLSAPLYKLQAKAGEKAFPIEGTYKDAVEHLLEPRITARIQSGEIVEVLYNFEKDEKTIKFVFVDMATSTPVSLDSVLPSISFADGSRQPISSETFTFRGTEIYDDKKIIADNPTISISPRSERLDLSRLSDNQELKVYVQQGFNLAVEQNFTNLTITFVNKNTGETKPFSNQKMIHLPGSITDWNVYVDTENYVAPIQAIAVRNGRLYIQGLQRRAKDVSKKTGAQIKPTTTDVAVQTNIPTFNLSDGRDNNRDADKGKGHKVKWHKYLLLLPILVGIIVGGVWLYNKYISKDINVNERNYSGGSSSDMGCFLLYTDNADESKRDTLDSNKASNFSFEIKDSDGDALNKFFKPTWWGWNHKDFLVHQLTLNDDYGKKVDNLTISVSYIVGYDTLQLVDQIIPKEKIKSEPIENYDTIVVNLGILLSQCRWYDEIKDKNFVFKDEQSKLRRIEEINNLSESEFKRNLYELASSKGFKKIDKPTQEIVPSKNNDKLNYDELSSITCNLSDKNLSRFDDLNRVIEGTTVSKRIYALKEVRRCINGKPISRPRIDNDLSKEQQNKLLEIFDRVNDETLQKNKKTFSSINDFYNNYKQYKAY